MASQDPLEENADRIEAIRHYQELLREKQDLTRQIEWLRSQLAFADDTEEAQNSDLLFLAEYARKERHFTVGAGNSSGYGDATVLDLTVQQRMEKMSTVLWPSGCVLAEIVMRELGDLCRRGAQILELGCGTAVPSIVAASLGGHVLATDAEIASADTVISHNRHALETGNGGSISTATLKWGALVPMKPWGAILVADGIYDESGHASLAATLANAIHTALESGVDVAPRVLIAYQKRQPEKEHRFFSFRLRDVGLQCKELTLNSLPLSDDLRSVVRVMDVSLAEGEPCKLAGQPSDFADGLDL